VGCHATLIIVVAGVSGSGKSTVATMLADRLHYEFADADAFHPAANIAKMHAGIPLDDADRQPWLHAIEHWMDAQIAAGRSAVVTCSALRRAYRQALLDGRPQVRLVFLDVSRTVAAARLATRRGHFFPPGLLDSQFGTLEPPDQSEDVLVINADRPVGLLVSDILDGLRIPGEEAS
jgi:carbohydrate kinase (thermoresistant glucokinase family)